jgi:hypothetical protein
MRPTRQYGPPRFALIGRVVGVANPGFNDPRQLEHWVDGLTLLDETFLTRAPEVAELPLIGRLTSRPAARSWTASRMMRTMVLRYCF